MNDRVAEQPLPNMEPATPLGLPVASDFGPGEHVKRPRGRLEANIDTLSYEVGRSFDRLWLPGEFLDEAIDIDQFRDIVGEEAAGSIPFTPGITAAEAERRLNLFEHEKRESQYEGYAITQTGTGMTAAFFDPVTLATLAVGNKQFAAARLTSAWGPYLKLMAGGGAKAGAASLPLEYIVQQAETGQTEPGRLAGSAIGPIVAAPALGALGRGLRAGFRGVRAKINGDDVAAAAHSPGADPTQNPMTLQRAIREAEDANLPVPWLNQRTQGIPVPKKAVRETFSDYEGGWVQFVRDLGARRSPAITRMRQMGLGPDDEVAVRLLRALGDDSDVRTVTPVDYNMRLVDLLNQFRSKEILDADQVQMLVDSGLVKMRGRMERTKPRVRVQPTKPRLRPGTDGKPRVRITGQEPSRPHVRIIGQEAGRPSIRFDLEGGKPRVRAGEPRPRIRITGETQGRPRVRVPPGKPRFRFVTDQGKPRLKLIDPGNEQVRFVGDEDGAELSVLGRRIVDALINPDKPLNRRLLQEVQERGLGSLRQRLQSDPRLVGEIDDLPRLIAASSVDEGTVGFHLEAMQFRRRLPDPDEIARTRGPTAETIEPEAKPADAASQSAVAQAREAGVEVDDIRESIGTIFGGMTTCGR